MVPQKLKKYSVCDGFAKYDSGAPKVWNGLFGDFQKSTDLGDRNSLKNQEIMRNEPKLHLRGKKLKLNLRGVCGIRLRSYEGLKGLI